VLRGSKCYLQQQQNQTPLDSMVPDSQTNTL